MPLTNTLNMTKSTGNSIYRREASFMNQTIFGMKAAPNYAPPLRNPKGIFIANIHNARSANF